MQPPIYQTHFKQLFYVYSPASFLLTLCFNYTWREMLQHCGVIHHRNLLLPVRDNPTKLKCRDQHDLAYT
jgi:hypothetical protein